MLKNTFVGYVHKLYLGTISVIRQVYVLARIWRYDTHQRYRGCDKIYCDIARRYIGIFLILGKGYIFRKAVIKSTPLYANLSNK